MGEMSMEILANGNLLFNRGERPKAIVTMEPFAIEALEMYD